MELVGRTVRKEFKGFGVFSGTVRSYDASTGYFEIVYEDGDSEELELSEVLPLMEGTDEEHAAAATCGDGLLHEKPRLGRKPKKRRRIERKREFRGRPGNVSENLVIDKKDLNENCDINNEFLGNLKESMGIGENSNGNCSLNDGFEVTLEIGHGFGRNLNEGVEINGELNLNVGETLEKERGFDLNTGFNLNEEADFEGVCDAYVESEENSRTRECIDLNLDVNGDFDEGLSVGDMGCSGSGTQRRKCDFDEGLSGGDMGCSNSGTQRRKCDFDLNVDVYEETKDMDDDCVVEYKDLHSSDMASESQKREICCDVEKKCAEGSDTNGSSEKVDLDINDVSLSKVIGGSQGAAVRDASLGLAEGPEKENSAYSGDLKFHASAGALDDSCIKDCCPMEVQSKDGLHEVGTTDVEGTQVDLASPSKQGNSRRKRRRQSDRLISTSEPVLRRSTRRGAAHNHVPKMSSTANDQLSSPAVSAVTEEKGAGPRCEGTKKTCVPPPKLQLPHSSQNLSLDEIPVLDLFAVYACLRSFSALLFLSPFELEDFVAALRCKSPSTLFDCIHFSILQTLRKHLEYLSNEGSESASNCLRSLNWDLLDLITWPIFMAEYLLIHGSGLKPGYVISQLKLFNSDYYKQPASVKVEVLHCLCDDMIEVEAIRSELSRRSLAAEPDMVFDRSMNMEVCKKRRVTADISGGSCLTEEIVEDGTDGNSDECCLCKMDGSLICCDGCPAAYHSKCVGITSDLLPEGDWYCPECSIDRHKPCIKPQKSLRGAELLGIDPHGRLFFSSCGYLLVSESCDTESSFSYYHRNDLKAVLEVLKTSEIFYSGIIMAICKHWDITMSLNGASNLDSLDISLSLDVLTKGQCPTIPALPASLASTEMNIVKNEADDVRKVEDNSISTSSGHLGCEVSKSLNFVNPMTAMECPNITSEGSAGTMQISLDDQNIPNHGDHDSKRAAELLDHSEVPGKIPSLGDSYLATSIDVGKENNIESTGPDHCSSAMTTRKGDTSRVNFGTGYVNYYSFALTASSVAEELMHKSSEKIEDNSLMSEEDIVSAQMKAIVKKYSKFCWPSIQGLVVNARKEKCGWCFSCKDPTDDRDCLFNTYLGPIQEGPTSDVVRLQSKKNRKGHLIDVVCHILSMVDRLRGLVLGPWLNPHHTKHWHKIFLKTSDISSLKHLLLTLESNLHPLTLSTEWSRHVDSVVTMGSASHVVISSLRTSSKQGISRKRGRSSETESNPSLNAAGGLGIFWWRGGRLSRQVFNWKVLPCTLASKAARQAGCTRIPGILYPENSEYAKRSRSIAWRAAVDTASSVEQLAFLVRELDSNIKWDEIENTHPLPALDKESRKSIRLFKKVIIRRKCTEGDVVKYLLDFGKRRAIPDVVKSHGSLVDESSSERKKYWLSECYVPLHLLKNFEERRTGRKSSEMKSLKPLGAGRVKKSSSWKKGLSYLFSKAERSEYYRCGHCNKEVLIREAVSCRYCKGYFHKRHVKKSDGPITAECTYTCHRCHNGTHGKIDAKIAKTVIKRGKVQSKKHRKASKDSRSVQIKRGKKASKGGQARLQNSKKAAPAVPLRRSPRKAKCLYLQNKRPGGRRKGKQKKSKKTTCKRPERCTSWQKKRTRVYHSYWLNGLLLSRKPNDERVMRFREKNILLSSEKLSVILDEPKCQLCCEADCASKLSHVACEICGGWFHGDAVGLNPENIGKLIGFRCHVCCKRDPPICPHVLTVENEVSQLVVEAQSNDVVECNDEVSNAVPPLSEIACN